MRAALSTWPPPLLRRWVLTIAAGAGFFLVGIAVWLASQDRMILILSGTLFLLSLVRAVQLYRCFAQEDYAVVDGAAAVALGLQRRSSGLGSAVCLWLLQPQP